jgi:hypothetical protein
MKVNKKVERDQLQLLTDVEVADLLKWSPQTLRKARQLQRGPKFIRLGRNVRYRATDLAAYLDRCPSGGSAA